MTPQQIDLMKQAARNLLAHRDAGRKCDPHAIEWAERMLAVNDRPARDLGPRHVDELDAQFAPVFGTAS